MKENYTHIALLIDRSGSMHHIKNSMEEGIQKFIEEQKNFDGECTITVATFDDIFEVELGMSNIKDVPFIEIKPRGYTALIDSMYKLINYVGEKLNSLNEDEKPDRVLFVTITDGEENSSKEYKTDDLAKKIKEQEEKYNWNFTYIGANQDMFLTAKAFRGRMGNSLSYSADASGVSNMFDVLNNSTIKYRSIATNSISFDSFSYTNEQVDNGQVIDSDTQIKNVKNVN